jgi:hypothetical protein
MTLLSCKRNGPHSVKSLRKSGEHHEVGVKADAFQAASAERGAIPPRGKTAPPARSPLAEKSEKKRNA